MSKPSLSRPRSRALIVVIFLLSVVPFLLAWLYARHPEWIGSRSNYGSLIIPPRPLDHAELLARPMGPPGSLDGAKGHWILLQVIPGPCGPACAETLHKTHQVRLMVNKDIERVRRLLLVPAANLAEYQALLKDDLDLLVGGAPEAVLRTLAEVLGHPPGEDMAFMVDPLGNLVLWYPGGFDPYGLLKDLKHLLRASQIG
jgi:hypothetical protein